MGSTRTLAGLLGSALKPQPNRPGLIANLDDLDAPQLRVDAAAAQPE
jgi:hypothetical protein